MYNTIAQILGFCGTAVTFFGYQQRKRKNIILFTSLSACIFMIHYILLGAYTGAVLNLVCALRGAVFANSDKKWARSKFWLFFFIAVNIICCVFTWDKWFSFLPLLGMILSTVSFWLKKESKIRFITLPSSPCWLVYNALCGSVAGVITECFITSSLLIAIVRYDILKKKRVVKNGQSQ